VNAIFFPDQVHGWVNRGDVNVESTRNDVEKSIQISLDFFRKLL